jgi:hypothetical protein
MVASRRPLPVAWALRGQMDVSARGLLLAVAGCAAIACAPSPPDPDLAAYLDDAAFRRAKLVDALVNPDNLYSRQRLAHYATGDADDWDRLPEWNPPVEPIAPAELDAPGGAVIDTLSGAAPLALPTERPTNEASLVALGRAAFARYPTQIAPYLAVALSSRAAAATYGLWIDGGVGGLVRVRLADGSATVALTCSTCHSGPDARGALVAGLPNRALDLGRALAEGSGAAPLDSTWGPGRLDVTTEDGTEPARIPDLRPVRWQSFLQQDATLRGADLTVLAIRIETLIVTAGQAAVRPPRLIALALAAYLRSLGGDLPSEEMAAREAPRGAAQFARSCAGCHVPPALTGDPVALATIGTDPTLGLSPNRGTGAYRVPSLHGVGTRGPLLHDGTLPSVEAMFDPGRFDQDFANRLHGRGAVAGHVYGFDLPVADRNDLIDCVRRL